MLNTIFYIILHFRIIISDLREIKRNELFSFQPNFKCISIYTQIGLILVLGMSAKNAILIVEYAMDFRKTGVPIVKAAHDAGVIRFRPIMMTALAFIFGVLPMLFSSGAGANSRIELGTAVVFGMLVNAIIGTTCVPAFWVVMQRLQERGHRSSAADTNTPPPAASASANQV